MAGVPPDGVVYEQSFDAILRGADVASHPQLLERIKALGYDPAHPQPSYPPSAVLAVLELVARERFPDRTLDEAYRELGHRAFQAFRTTLAGRVVLAALGMLDVERTLKMAMRGFSSTASFARHELVKVGPRHVVFCSLTPFLPRPYVRGLLEELLSASRHGDAFLSDGLEQPDRREFVVTW